MGGGSDLTRLARLAGRTRRADLSAATVSAAQDVVLDTLGAILAGSRWPENSRLARLAAERSGPKTATLIGHGQRAEPMWAALANAIAGVTLEVDEGTRWGGGHPAVHVLPALLAVAEEQGANGPRVIESLVAGYEITARLGAATEPRPNVHSHGTWGTIGAGVAVARLQNRDAAAIGQVINLAASMSPANSWAPCFAGATVRNLYPGRAARDGILAAHLLDCGYTAPCDAPADVFGTILGDRFDADRALAGLDGDDRPADYRIQHNYFKLHACCLYNHPALDALQALRARESFDAEAVTHVTVTSIPFVTRMADPLPPNMLAAKFSVPYAVAAALIHGTAGVHAFLDPVREDCRVQDLARRVEVRGEPTLSLRQTGAPAARVAVTLRDGRVLTATTDVVRGDAANPVPREELVAKFTSLAGEVLGADRARLVAETVARLDELKDVRELTALLATG